MRAAPRAASAWPSEPGNRHNRCRLQNGSAEGDRRFCTSRTSSECSRHRVFAERSLRRAPRGGRPAGPPGACPRLRHQELSTGPAPVVQRPVDDLPGTGPAEPQIRALVRLRGAQAARQAGGHAQPAQAPDPRRARPPCGRRWRTGLWVVRLRAPFDRRRSSLQRRFAGAAAQRARRARRAAAGARRRRRGAGGMTEPAQLAATAATRADRAGARLPAAAQPVAGQRLPLRAHLLGLCAGRARAPRRAAAAPARRRRLLRCHPWCAGGHRPGARACPGLSPGSCGAAPRAATVPPISVEPTRPSMTDMRRTLLWVVFSMSLVLIWDAWNKHNGQPSMFSRRRRREAGRRGAAPPRHRRPSVPASGRRRWPACRAGRGAGRSPLRLRRRATEQVVITTDLVKATLDSHGGDLVRAELLKQGDQVDPTAQRRAARPVGRAPVPGPDRADRQRRPAPACPTTTTPMTLVPGERTLSRRRRTSSQVSFESPAVGGVKLVKTYTFQRGDYVDRREARGGQRRQHAGHARSCTCSSCATATPPAGESSFYFTFTGPAIYTDASKYKKIDFKDIEKRKPDDKPDHETTADNGWVAMVQHYFASAWLLGATTARSSRASSSPRKVGDQHATRSACSLPLGEVAPGRQQGARRAAVRRPAGRKQAGRARARAWSWSRTTAGSPSWPSRCSGCSTQLHTLIGNWGWAIVGAGGAAEDRVLLAQRQGLHARWPR